MSINSTVGAHPALEIWLIRHGETDWSVSGQHTGHTDVPLTARGREQARALAPLLATCRFDQVLTSPMSRARETSQLAGLGSQARIEQDLREWNYGIYEGRSTSNIRKEVPTWSVWNSEIPEGEDLRQITERVQGVMEKLLSYQGRIAIVSHAHFSRAFAGYWIYGLAALGEHLMFDTAAVSVLGFDRGVRVIRKWNLRLSDAGA